MHPTLCLVSREAEIYLTLSSDLSVLVKACLAPQFPSPLRRLTFLLTSSFRVLSYDFLCLICR